MSGNYGNNNGGFKAPPREKRIMDMPALKLVAPRTQGQERAASLMFYVHPNIKNPSNTEARIVVFTQTPDNDPKKQKIEVKLNLLDAMAIVKAVDRVSKLPKGVYEEPIVAQNTVPKDFRNPQAGKRDNAKIYVGRTEQGVYMSLISWNQEVPRLRFFFGADPDSTFQWVINAEKGQTFSEHSALTAEGWADLIGSYLKDEFKLTWKPWKPQQQQQGGGNYGSNGGNYGGNNGGGNNYGGNSGAAAGGNADADPFDDLPM